MKKKFLLCLLSLSMLVNTIPVLNVVAFENYYSTSEIATEYIEFYDVTYLVEEGIEILFEDEFSEFQEQVLILDKILLDEYTVLITYEYEYLNAEGYIEIEANSILLFKKVAITTWMAFKNPEVTRRLSTVVSRANMDLMTNQRITIVRTALRNQSFGSQAALGQRIANELVRQTGMRQGNADAIGLGVRQLVNWR